VADRNQPDFPRDQEDSMDAQHDEIAHSPRSPQEEATEPGLTRRAALAGATALVGAGIVGVAGVGAQGEETTPVAEEASLYERLGGAFAIAAVVDRFSDEIIKNPKLNENPALKTWNETEAATRLPGLKFMRTVWIIAQAGGPIQYTGLPLDEAHRDLNLTADEFAEVGNEILLALRHFNVPEREQLELVEAYNASMDDVVSAPE
jgi:hemoglobin